MRNMIKKAMPVLACLALGVQAMALEAPLKYVAQDPDGERFFYARSSVELKAAAPEGDWKLPAFTSPTPLFATIKLGETERLMILDLTKADDPSYSRIHIDRNGNRDLTDDDPVDGEDVVSGIDADFANYQFPSVDLEYQIDGTTLPYRVGFMLVCYNLSIMKTAGADVNQIRNSMCFLVESLCDYETEVKIGEQTYAMAFVDNMFDGRFECRMLEPARSGGANPTFYPQGDEVFIGPKAQWTYFDSQTLCPVLAIGEQAFRPGIDCVGKKLTLSPIESRLVSVKLPGAIKRLTLIEDGSTSGGVTVYRNGGEAVLPAGNYKLLGYQMTRKDQQGDLWMLQANGSVKAEPFKVEQNGDALAMGEPLEMMVEATERNSNPIKSLLFGKKSVNVYLNFSMTGQAGEEIASLMRIEGDQTKIAMSEADPSQPREPKWMVTLEDGEVVTKGDFHYG